MIPRIEPHCQIENHCDAPRRAWQELLSTAPRSTASLLKSLDLTDSAHATLASDSDFPLRVPQPFVDRMQKGDPNDPLLLQVLPRWEEQQAAPGYSRDPLQEQQFNVAPGLIHKYHGRALLITAKACAIHCRYCFRRHFPYEDNQPSREQWQGALDYLANDSSISEVIYSGGDPLAAGDRQLAWLSEQIAAIPHIVRLRIHSRLPIVLPQRIDDALLDWLQRWPGEKVMVVHSNHPNELDDSVATALEKLSRIGVTLLNQTVLLKGINDDEKILAELSEKLFGMGVMPYYLHVLDAVAGAAHFDISDDRAQRIAGEISARLPGYLVPRLVRENPNCSAKTPLTPILPAR